MNPKIILGILGGLAGLFLFSRENSKPAESQEKKPKSKNEKQPITINVYTNGEKENGGKKGHDPQKEENNEENNNEESGDGDDTETGE